MSALHAEWTKLRTLAGTWWLLLAVIVLTVAAGSGTAAAVTCPAAGCGQDPARIALAGVDLSQAVVAILAVLALGTAAAVRDSAVSIGAVLGLLYLFPVIASALARAGPGCCCGSRRRCWRAAWRSGCATLNGPLR